ncbi:hypothetical protein GQ53DRAFT_793220 [Thozetella sp. PMI_491]|nr:hypothetical protein GQ53DRAFT_793220 [Thozetella sp. PMI_491]
MAGGQDTSSSMASAESKPSPHAPAPKEFEPTILARAFTRPAMLDRRSSTAGRNWGARFGEDGPEFDSLAPYRVEPEIANELRQAEARRLVEIINDPTKPLALKSSEFLEGKGDAAGYKRVSAISQDISTALTLCLLDNECVNVNFCTRIANRERLQKMIRQARVAAKVAATVAANEAADPRNDPALALEQQRAQLMAIFNIVDYISAILARLISQTASGPLWLENVVAALVCRIAKIKFLLVDIVSNAVVAADTGQETLETSQDREFSASAMDQEEEECEEALRIIDANKKDGLTSEEEADIASFCVNQNKYRSGINTALKYILGSLRIMNVSGLPSTTYEVCVVVYEIGFEGFKTVLFQDKDLEYSASSSRDVLNTAQAALTILDQVLGNMKKHQKPAKGPGNTAPDELRTTVQWAYRELSDPLGTVDYAKLSNDIKSIELNTLGDIITAMVPLITTSPIMLAGFTNFRTMIALTGGVRDVVKPFRDGQFGAFCRLYTNEFDKEAKSREILRLSKAFKDQSLSRCRLLTHGKGRWGAKIWDSNTSSEGDLSCEVLERLGEHSEEMDQWVIDEKSVTISCRFYVISVMAFALTLGCGGLAIGFTLGQRIDGVDPFNLASYTWVLAAFVLLICKSILVENWNWSDFLRLRVRCRSVSELAATTGVNEQLIIAKLLHDDCGDGILLTRGPFNSVFRRQTDDSNGFSIDRPVSAGTLMLSGLALLKVVTPRGHAIACLDYRRGTFLTVVEHQGKHEKSRLICDDVNRLNKDNTSKRWRSWRGPEPVRLHLGKAEDFMWKRVQGLYDFNGADVVFT